MSNFETTIFKKSDGVGYVTLNRPKALNTYNIQMRDDLYEILNAIRVDPEIRVVVFKGSGEKAFCAGADLSDFLKAPSPIIARKVRFDRDVWGLFLKIPQPVIAALHGYILGSGIEIALCCDFRIASKDARFGLPEVNLGIIPAAGGTQTLPRTIGRGKAMEMLLTNRSISGEEAYEIGLVNEVTERETLYDRTRELAEIIASKPPVVVRLLKQAVVRGMDLSLAEGLNLENRLASELALTKITDP